MLLFRSFDDNSLRLDTVTQYTVESVQLFSSLKRLNLTNQPNLQNLRPAVGTVILSPTVNILWRVPSYITPLHVRVTGNTRFN